jgi:hypothetical protein
MKITRKFTAAGADPWATTRRTRPKAVSRDLLLETSAAKQGVEHMVMPPNSCTSRESVEWHELSRHGSRILIGSSEDDLWRDGFQRDPQGHWKPRKAEM